MKNLNISQSRDVLCDVEDSVDSVLRAIEKYKKHPNIKTIADISKNNNFTLEEIFYEEILDEIQKLDKIKARQDTDVF